MTGSTVLTGAVGAIPLRTAAVLDAISRAILTGELPPGRSLVEADLATALGVSKTPVREALKTLAGAGLVTMSPYRGATVRAIDDATARSIYDMRLLLEPEAVRRAVARPGPARTAAAGSRPRARRSRPRITRPVRPHAAWPTASSIAPCTWAAATRCWPGPWTTCGTRRRSYRWRPGSRSRPGASRPRSTRPSSRPRPTATASGPPDCSPRTSAASPHVVSPAGGTMTEGTMTDRR